MATPSPAGQYDDNSTGLREDGSFDFTRFFSKFDSGSELGKYIDKWDPAKFLALLRVAASSIPKPGQASKPNLSFSEEDIKVYHSRLDARQEAKVQLEKNIEELDGVINKMDIPGAEVLKSDFKSAKTFIFDSIANSNSRIMDIHLEFEESFSAPGTPRTPASPVLGTIPLPAITPAGTPSPGAPHTLERRWSSMLAGPDGLVYRVVATPRDVPFEPSCFLSTSHLSRRAVPLRATTPTLRPPPAPRPNSNRPRSLSGLRTTSTSQ